MATAGWWTTFSVLATCAVGQTCDLHDLPDPPQRQSGLLGGALPTLGTRVECLAWERLPASLQGELAHLADIRFAISEEEGIGTPTPDLDRAIDDYLATHRPFTFLRPDEERYITQDLEDEFREQVLRERATATLRNEAESAGPFDELPQDMQRQMIETRMEELRRTDPDMLARMGAPYPTLKELPLLTVLRRYSIYRYPPPAPALPSQPSPLYDPMRQARQGLLDRLLWSLKTEQEQSAGTFASSTSLAELDAAIAARAAALRGCLDALRAVCPDL